MASDQSVVEAPPNPRVAATWPRIDQFSVTAISKASALSRASILDIRSGKTANPGIVTLESLESGLTKLEEAVAKKQSSENTEEIQTKSRKSVAAAGGAQ